jgi:uncharacterized protein (DUF305 family)
MRTMSKLTWVVVAAALGGPAFAARPAQPPPLVQPGAPGQPTRIITPEKATALPHAAHTGADVTFMQEMIGHHSQAIEMVELLKTRTRRQDMQLLGKRIDLSQADEIRMMHDWLRARGQPIPDAHAHHRPGAKLMPGMLTAEEMARLEKATGPAFDTLFLTLMIKHHNGALAMVEALLQTPGAAQESEIFAFTTDIVADQRMEIERMAAMLTGGRK